MNNLNKINISVVIATLGGDSLKGTIEQLNNGSIVPSEILVCIPNDFAVNVQKLQFDNLKIISTECKGQVAQRAIGFQNAKFDLVLQLDDDLNIDFKCIENLLNILNSLPFNSAVAPQYLVKGTKNMFHQRPSSLWLLNLYYFFINGSEGYKQGVITKAGTPIGCTFEDSTLSYKQSEWLPGGCVLHRKKNLVTYNFYPLAGKAYSEDLFHSMLLKKNGICLYVVKEAFIEIDLPESFGFKKNLINIISDFKARKNFITQFPTNKSYLRMLLFYLLNLKRHLFRN